MFNKNTNLYCSILILLFFTLSLHAKHIDISENINISLLKNSSIYITTEYIGLQEIIDKKKFTPYNKPQINVGASQHTIWVKLQLKNNTSKRVEKLLIVTSPLIEHISLFQREINSTLITSTTKGVSHITDSHTTLFPYFILKLKPYSKEEYFIKVQSLYEPIDFSLLLKDATTYINEDRMQQFINIMLIGVVLAFMFYSLLLSFYTKDKSYRYYSLYLFMLIYQQMTYLGLTQIYLPHEFVKFDILLPIVKINILLITAALFAISFLKIDKKSTLYTIYKYFIFVALAEIIILSIPGFYNLDIVIITGLLFIIFNLIASINTYLNGYTQARLFIVGFSIVFISYLLIILNALGLTSLMQDFQNILIFGTAFEALILSLAFADRYTILQREKDIADKHILNESKERAMIIEHEVIKKTHDLKNALKTRDLLLKEVHHRVKNNLQIILSMIRLQSDKIEDEAVSSKFTNLENRINAIAKTYNMLLIKENLNEIDMQEYIDSLLFDICETLYHSQQHVSIHTHVKATVPLRESVYIGLIINEVVTNAYKYAFDKKKGNITISLQQNNHSYILSIEDDGRGFTLPEYQHTLGLKLIHTLVYDQLGGIMELNTDIGTKYQIRFTI